MNRSGVHAAIDRYALRLPRQLPRGQAGERLGRGVGSSIEFQDYRPYAPGDDLRHVDWTAYARRDELLVRLHREEIAPRLDIVVDLSLSMASTERKRDRVLELAAFFFDLARADRLSPVTWIVGDGVRKLDSESAARPERWTFDGVVGMEAVLRMPPKLGRRSLRLVISDLLFEGDAAPIVRRLAADAAALSFVQVLDDDEATPDYSGGHRLTDVESGQVLDVVVTPGMAADYVRRLGILQESWRLEAHRAGGVLAVATASPSLPDVCRDVLRPAGIVAVRGIEA